MKVVWGKFMSKLSYFLNSKIYLLFLSLIFFRSFCMSNEQDKKAEKYKKLDIFNGTNKIVKDFGISPKKQNKQSNNISDKKWRFLLDFIFEKLSNKQVKRKAIDKLNSESVIEKPYSYILAGLIIYRANWRDTLSINSKTNTFKQLNQAIIAKHVDFIRSKIVIRNSAIESEYLWLFNFLISQEIDFEIKNLESLVLLATRENSLELLEYCIEKGADLDYQEKRFGMTALMLASYKGYIPIMKRLIKDYVDIDAEDINGKAAIKYAVEWGKTEAVELLLDEDAYIDDTGLLMLACFHGYDDIIDLLVERRDVNIADSDGTTPLMLLAKEGNRKMVKKAIKKGADVNAAKTIIDSEDNCRKETALSLAMINGHPNIVRLLVRKGAKDDFFE